MASNKPAGTAQTQRQRRVKYGLNVAVTIVAAVLIVVMINWTLQRQLPRVPAGALPWIRYDLTATRRYSLSDQTRNVLKDLKDEYRIVTLISQTDPNIEQGKELIAEYGHYSPKLTVQHINPLSDRRIEDFHQELRKHYEDQIRPMIDKIDLGKQALEQLRSDAKQLLAPLQKILKDREEEHAKVGRQQAQQGPDAHILNVAQWLARSESAHKKILDEIDTVRAANLPDYAVIKSKIEQTLGAFEENAERAINLLNDAIGSKNTPNGVKDKLLGVIDLLKDARKNLAPALEGLRSDQGAEDYDKLITQLSNPDTVVIVGPREVRVIPLAEMFKPLTPEERQRLRSGEQPQRQFLGEEKITGALIAMQLDHPPMVVFIRGGRQPAIGFGGQYLEVAERLGNLNFRVEEWSPAGRAGFQGQPLPPRPPPKPEPGQKVVWIVLPIDAPNNPMMPSLGPAPQIVAHVKGAMGRGEAALVILHASMSARFGAPDPIAELVKPWGITPRTDRVVFHQFVQRDRNVSTSQILINRWPKDLPIGQALAGMRGIVVQASPLDFDLDKADGAKISKLIELTDQPLFASDDFGNPSPTLRPEMQAEQFTIGAAVQKDDKRLVVIADPLWATDQVTTYAERLGPGWARLVGAAFPGNAELFVNSVIWLSGLDQLIAASARTQDIRRIEEVTENQLRALTATLVLGLPLLTLLTGAGVWLVRRRG